MYTCFLFGSEKLDQSFNAALLNLKSPFDNQLSFYNVDEIKNISCYSKLKPNILLLFFYLDDRSSFAYIGDLFFNYLPLQFTSLNKILLVGYKDSNFSPEKRLINELEINLLFNSKKISDYIELSLKNDTDKKRLTIHLLSIITSPDKIINKNKKSILNFINRFPMFYYHFYSIKDVMKFIIECFIIFQDRDKELNNSLFNLLSDELIYKIVLDLSMHLCADRNKLEQLCSVTFANFAAFRKNKTNLSSLFFNEKNTYDQSILKKIKKIESIATKEKELKNKNKFFYFQPIYPSKNYFTLYPIKKNSRKIDNDGSEQIIAVEFDKICHYERNKNCPGPWLFAKTTYCTIEEFKTSLPSESVQLISHVKLNK